MLKLTEEDKNAVNKSHNKDTVEDFHYELLKKKASRKWQIVEVAKYAAAIITASLLVLTFMNYKAVAETAMLWTAIVIPLWGTVFAYAGLGGMFENMNKKS